MLFFVYMIKKAGYILSDMILAEQLRKSRVKNELTMRKASWHSESCVNSSGKITQGNLSRPESVKDQSEHSEALDALQDP